MIGMRLVLIQKKTARTRILEFLREPFMGTWLGEPGFLPVKTIADGADVSVCHARKVLAALDETTKDRLFTEFRDEEQEGRAKYASGTATRIRTPDGGILSPWDCAECFDRPSRHR